MSGGKLTLLSQRIRCFCHPASQITLYKAAANRQSNNLDSLPPPDARVCSTQRVSFALSPSSPAEEAQHFGRSNQELKSSQE